MDKVTYFDVEWANSKNRSICQLGLISEGYEGGNPYSYSENFYINPEDRFDDLCVGVHGISADKVSDKPTFPDVWREIEKYFTGCVVIGHNVAAADLDALIKSLRRYNIAIPEICYVCTLQLSKKYIPNYAVPNYKMASLCNYFDIEIDSAHDAYCDVCATAELCKSLVAAYSIDLERQAKKYVPHETKEFTQYISSPEIRKSMSDFYGVIRGFSIDNIITEDEVAYIKQWRERNKKYCGQEEIRDVICTIDQILEDNVVSVEEIVSLQRSVQKYLDIVSTSPVTLATQILDGMMRGIILDGNVSYAECNNLRQWLYDNIYLSGNYPFDQILKVVEGVLEDSIITKEESEFITETVKSLLDPVQSLKSQINSVENKHVCLSGTFSYGQKSDVEKYIAERHGFIDSSVKKTTDILVVGDGECVKYSNGTYGTKVKKALEYNEKECAIQILKESDFFSDIR